MALTTNLVSYWTLNETSGNAADSLGVNTLTNTSTVAYSSGKINNGALMVGATPSYFAITNGSQTGLGLTGGEMSVAFWIKMTSLPAS